MCSDFEKCINARDENGHTALHIAMERRKFSRLKILLEFKAGKCQDMYIAAGDTGKLWDVTPLITYLSRCYCMYIMYIHILIRVVDFFVSRYVHAHCYYLSCFHRFWYNNWWYRAQLDPLGHIVQRR